MEKVLINGHPCLIGNDPDDYIEKSSYKDLDINSKVTSIGRRYSGMETKLCFDSPATYKGIYTHEEDRYLAFEIDKREILGRDLFNNFICGCILLLISGNTLYLQDFHNLVNKEVKPIFYNEKQLLV